jgi:hypothetical protein
MMKRLSALALVLALGVSVLAGVPLHSNDNECSMTGMMDCCKLAQMQMDSPEAAAARLCCAINCSQPAQTESTSAARRSTPAVAPVHPAVAALPATSPRFSPFGNSTFPHSANPQPSYILNLALLI